MRVTGSLFSPSPTTGTKQRVAPEAHRSAARVSPWRRLFEQGTQIEMRLTRRVKAEDGIVLSVKMRIRQGHCEMRRLGRRNLSQENEQGDAHEIHCYENSGADSGGGFVTDAGDPE